MILSKLQLADYTGGYTTVNSSVRLFSESTSMTSVFLSHKHSDRDLLLRIKRLLECSGISVYIDWLDESMPKKTRGETGMILKQKIRIYDKFILVATDDAIKSQWCNWELGLGDAEKYDKDKIALFPLRNDAASYWAGTEYMAIYPVIEYEDGTEKNSAGNVIPRGYYVMYPAVNGGRRYVSLNEWLLK